MRRERLVMSKSGRTYSDYDRAYNARPENVAKRVANNRLRREAIREGRVRKGDGNDIDHIRPMADGGPRNGPTRVVPASQNRARKPDAVKGKR
jgi:hypothetical protein